ncbi:hypothetical protein [Burkholderia cenocepacia]|uniref:hypothetical protein n=1 Tax=Burkholderia cenocepacia TaxID=95486 RepID=UPI001BA39000|nr:hypothetical protein [Burkholderia cenocepacia]MBR8135132.1 hypothetical protein [Burkholderia cenocepacia]
MSDVYAKQPEELKPVEEVANKYVAFCDILGFSAKLANDFDKALDVYRRFGERLDPDLFQTEVKMTMYSDAILLTCDELAPLLSSVQSLWFVALTEDLMLRGGIAYGRYWERRHGDHLMVVSDALVSAVKIEGMVSVPAVALADDIKIPLEFWAARYAHGPFGVPLLHFRDRNIVNPFNLMWGVSAAGRCHRLMEESPAHKQKYLWFLALYEAVYSNAQLVPDSALRELLEKGIVKWIPPGTAPEQLSTENPAQS